MRGLRQRTGGTIAVAGSPESSRSPVYLRPVQRRDRRAFITAMQQSAGLHAPWIYPPTNAEMFSRYLRRVERDDHAGLLVLERGSDAIAGCFNLNNMVRGSFLCASLGYYAALPFAGRGYMREGLTQLLLWSRRQLGLHRLEANIQPGNLRSIALVKRCGFRKEGVSRNYLFIDGAWRDHERWAWTDNRRTLEAQP